MKLLTVRQTKLNKSEEYGWRTIGLALSPATEYSQKTLCAFSGLCAATCLSKTGHNVYPTHIRARMARTEMFWKTPTQFNAQLLREIQGEVEKSKRDGIPLAIRPNLLSDRPDIGHLITQNFPTIKVYDYTKLPTFRSDKNYHLTYSVSERTTQDEIDRCVREGVNPSIIFPIGKKQDFPEKIKLGGMWWWVIDGDKHDLRFLDPQGVVVGLRWKGGREKIQQKMVYGGLNV